MHNVAFKIIWKVIAEYINLITYFSVHLYVPVVQSVHLQLSLTSRYTWKFLLYRRYMCSRTYFSVHLYVPVVPSLHVQSYLLLGTPVYACCTVVTCAVVLTSRYTCMCLLYRRYMFSRNYFSVHFVCRLYRRYMCSRTYFSVHLYVPVVQSVHVQSYLLLCTPVCACGTVVTCAVVLAWYFPPLTLLVCFSLIYTSSTCSQLQYLINCFIINSFYWNSIQDIGQDIIFTDR